MDSQEKVKKLNELKVEMNKFVSAGIFIKDLWDEERDLVGELLDKDNGFYPFNKQGSFDEVMRDVVTWSEVFEGEVDEAIQDIKETYESFKLPLLVIKQTVGWEEFLRVTGGLPDYKEDAYDDGHIFTITKKQAREMGFPINNIT